jgi:hypothetical protein
MKKISQQYATSYSQNSYKRYESVMNDEHIKQKLLELQSTLKTQIDELKLLKSQQQQPGMFFSPQMGFQNQNHYVFQPAINQYPLQAVDNNNHFANPPAYQHAPSANNHQHNDERPHPNNNKRINENITLEQKIRKESELACSDSNFAVRLMRVFFKDDELRVENLNVYGQTMRGTYDEKVSLDPERVGFIKERVLNRWNGDEKLKKTISSGCVSAMNKKIRELRSKN